MLICINLYLRLPPKEHLRVFVRAGEIPALKQKMQHSAGKKILGQLTKASVPRTPKKAAKEDCFLNVMQVMDNACTPLPVQLIDADKVVGVDVADRVVTFSRDTQAITEGFVFEIPKSAGKKVKVLMMDLSEGKWTISNARKKVVTTADVKADSGVLYFSAEPGRSI